ncbi:MAG: apolipoprotein N-acyltransferase [Planctomyces sp.]|nr:apolipoprotein N-acyltransferase [Planctomyces sp.]
MSTALADAPVRRSRSHVSRDRSIDDIISSARRRPATVRGAAIPALLSGGLMWASFAPLDFGFLGWIALVPLLQLVRLPRMTRRAYLGAWLGGCAFTFPALQWMRLGDPSMYLAWFALAAYLALTFPAFVGICRIACRRFQFPLIAAAPAVWVGLEFLRAHLFTGFGWYLLGHTQYRWTALVQISDLVGAYGVSFVVVMASAAIAGFVPPNWLVRLGMVVPDDRPAALATTTGRRELGWGVGVAVVLLAASVTYGYVRIGQSDFKAGPRIALIQGNFTTSLKHDPQAWSDIYSKHRALTGMSVPHQPDVIVWPETMYRMPLFQAGASTDEQLDRLLPNVPAERWRDPAVSEDLRRLSSEANAALIIGIDALIAEGDAYSHYNSAAFVKPEDGLSGRYDKIHRVPFGEYIPLRETLPFLRSLTPFGDDFGIAAGDAVHVFRHQDWTFLPLICFEDTVPHLVRSMERTAAAERPVDVLVNLTNDGWFHGSSELEQHLITATFRCIENRTPMVRAVNTGISAFIDGNGQVREPNTVIDLDAMLNREQKLRTSIRDPETGKFHKQWNAAFIADVPLDSRTSLYTKLGDWFGVLCSSLCVLLIVGPIVLGRRQAPAVHPAV